MYSPILRFFFPLQKNFKMSKKKTTTIVNQASYEAYLYELFALAVSAQPTAIQSLEDILLDKATSCGRKSEAAQGDVQGVLNIKSAVALLLKKMACQFSDSDP